MIVLDASVAVKWFRAETYNDLAEAILIDNTQDIIAPDHFAVEVSSALVRNANVNKAVSAEMLAALSRFVEMIEANVFAMVRLTPDQLAMATAQAIDIGHPLKDCLYLALAMELGCDLVTADTRFAAKAKGVWAGVRVLGE